MLVVRLHSHTKFRFPSVTLYLVFEDSACHLPRQVLDFLCTLGHAKEKISLFQDMLCIYVGKTHPLHNISGNIGFCKV